MATGVQVHALGVGFALAHLGEGRIALMRAWKVHEVRPGPRLKPPPEHVSRVRRRVLE